MSNRKAGGSKYENRNLPWYRHGWVWLIILLPSSVVIASFVTLYIAITNAPESAVEEMGKRTEYKEERKENMRLLDENFVALNVVALNFSSKEKNDK